MPELRALVAAAGRGTRAGLPYPKTLHPVQGMPILIRIVELLAPYDDRPTVVVSPEGRSPVADCLEAHGVRAHLVVQPAPLGMGDAVLRFEDSPAACEAEHVLLVWGDIPFIQSQTVAATVAAHFEQGNVLTFASRNVTVAYTQVVRDSGGCVTGLVETRENGVIPGPGERDIGLFVFHKDTVLSALREAVPGRVGRATGEHGFLYVVGLLAQRGLRVGAVPVATELDLVSLNSLDDLKGHG
ncbi:MAG: NTP transferase domain-containing protein [Xanthomonadaceae bacterium]|nr:NTP transferase domain-containing protein [Xanthomonadaceae bacterium]